MRAMRHGEETKESRDNANVESHTLFASVLIYDSITSGC